MHVFNPQETANGQSEGVQTLDETNNVACSPASESPFIETGKRPTNPRQKETYQKMIERVKEYHSKLDLLEHKDRKRVDLFVCYICFDVFLQHELLRSHYITVGHLHPFACVEN